MKIGFIGASYTGKTSTAKALSEVTNLPYHEGVTRKTFSYHGFTQVQLEHFPVETRYRVQLENFNNKLQQDNDNPNGIYDRTALDHLMYLLLYANTAIVNDKFNELLQQTQANLTSYDQLHYFPIYDWPLTDDGFRNNSLASRCLQDSILRGYIWKWDLPIAIMVDEPVEQRVQRMHAVIQHA